MSNLDRTTFFSYARKAPFGGRLTEEQVAGTEAILKAWKSGDLRHLAYILATAFHETGGRMVPVREGFAKTDAAARKIVAKYKYGKPDPRTGEVYYGRGHVQLTWAENYRKMGKILSLPLFDQPDIALEPDVSAQILIEGMTRGVSLRGDFTGKSLDDYFTSTKEDPVGARAIVNGQDKAQLIAGYYKSFLGALQHADTTTSMPTDVSEEAAEPDGTPLLKDKTTWGTITSVISAGGLGFLTAIDNPWALLAVVVVGFGVLLFLTGRLQIRRQAGA